MTDESEHWGKSESDKKMSVSWTRLGSRGENLKMRTVMSCPSQLMMTALEDALFARALIFRSDYSLFYVLYFTLRARQKRLDTPDKTTYLSTYLIGCFGELYLWRGCSVIQTTCQVISTSVIEIRVEVTQPITVITMSHNINAQRRQIHLDCCRRLITRGEM